MKLLNLNEKNFTALKLKNFNDEINSFFVKQSLQQNFELREAHHQKSLSEMEELKKIQSSTFDTIARRRLVEDQDTILALSGRIQDLQNEVNCMNDSKDFQDAESIRSGNSHGTSRPVSFPHHPIPQGMLSRSIGMPSRREGPPSIWGHTWYIGKRFCKSRCVIISTLSSRIEPMEFIDRGAASFIHRKRVKGEHRIKIRDASLDRQPKIQSSSAEEILQRMMGPYQQRLQISDLHFDKFPTPATLKEYGLILPQDLNPIKRTQWQKD